MQYGGTWTVCQPVPHFQWRDPWLEHDADTPIEAALMLSYGALEAYGYHGAE